MVQVANILLDSALRYSESGQEVHVAVGQNGSTAQLTIQNSGIGLYEEEAAQVFSRFYRGNGAQHVSNGSGLGLPVAKAIIEAHGGEFQLTGKLGEEAVKMTAK
ncbi:MAG: sensor histidine kinase [Pseudomonadota bacterium]